MAAACMGPRTAWITAQPAATRALREMVYAESRATAEADTTKRGVGHVTVYANAQSCP